MRPNKKAQEEMVGFVLILIIVVVIGLVFLRIQINNPNESGVESYEVESFLQAVLQSSSGCLEYGEYVEIRNLIFDCNNGQYCGNSDSCEILEQNLEQMVENSWEISNSSVYTGYEMIVASERGENYENLVNITKGKDSSNFKGAEQEFAKSGTKIRIFLKVYY